ncbi:hypothetical protein HNQ09_002131 [Deinococcus budaensis]|uniref:Uncharacterized protein n=1 Tax=Deinococcus budaensis TaxID=1665626 RepID=A0A7W8GFV3_9DEIO|nr:hypothetical protein [Deinococcus budaensis]MBB5234688.1 hypothetical protein [Deinococcus budaensis]
MKNIQGWTDSSVTHFANLAQFGEQLLLSVRLGNWRTANALQAGAWARFWRQKLQGYIYAYRAVAGVDLSADVTDNAPTTDRYLPPSAHLQRQLERQKRGVLPRRGRPPSSRNPGFGAACPAERQGPWPALRKGRT